MFKKAYDMYFNPLYAIEGCHEACRCKKYLLFLDFSPDMCRSEIKKRSEAVVFAVATRCNKFFIA